MTDDPGWGVSASFADIDRDGWLDLYVGNYLQYGFDADPECTGLTGRRVHCGPKSFPPQADRLYHNRGDGTFADVTEAALGGQPPAPALGIATADLDNDGWIDIYVANDQVDNLLWMNNGDGTLTNRARLSGTAVSADGRPEASMGVDAGDFDNDGDEDLTMTHLPSEGHNVYRNDGSGPLRGLERALRDTTPPASATAVGARRGSTSTTTAGSTSRSSTVPSSRSPARPATRCRSTSATCCSATIAAGGSKRSPSGPARRSRCSR